VFPGRREWLERAGDRQLERVSEGIDEKRH
jgi:hypothetical protein